MQKDSDKISPEMLKEAEKKMGMTPEQIAARMEVPLKFVTGCLR